MTLEGDVGLGMGDEVLIYALFSFCFMLFVGYGVMRERWLFPAHFFSFFFSFKIVSFLVFFFHFNFCNFRFFRWVFLVWHFLYSVIFFCSFWMHIKKLRKYFTKRICGGCGCCGGGSRDETDDKRRTYEESTNTHNRARFHTNLMNKWKEFLIKNYGREHTEHGGAQTHTLTHTYNRTTDRPKTPQKGKKRMTKERSARSASAGGSFCHLAYN